MIIQANTAEDQDMLLAKDVADTLHINYPGHLWAVAVKGGMVIIKALNISSLYGYLLKYKDVVHDAAYRKKEVMRAGGEILERAGMARQGWKGDVATQVEGIKNYSPARFGK